ncbi:hypothetical protein KR222_003341, partial [Zaprionus bogoriensis]
TSSCLQFSIMSGSDATYAEFLSSVVRSSNFTTVFYFAPDDENERCHMANWIPLTGKAIPWLTWNSVKSFKLIHFFGSELLILACLPGIYRQDLLNSISEFLQYMRQTKLLIELTTDEDLALGNRVLKFCLENYMLNAALYFSDFGKTHTVYDFEAYPHFEVKSHQIGQKQWDLYPDKTTDLKGYPLRTQPDLSEPNTILYYDSKGRAQLLGYVWNIVVEYSRKHNARLQFNYKPEMGRILNHIQIMDLARNNLVDLSASVQPITLGHYRRYREFAYPLHITNWCTMMPLHPYIDVSDVYTWILPALIVLFLAMLWLLHELLRGRWKGHNRLLSIGWLVLAGLLMFNVQGRLLALFIVPPAKGTIKSFEELQVSRTRILIYRNEYNVIDFNLRTKYASSFYLTDKVPELIAHRNALNTSFGYTVTKTKWSLYAEQQAHSSSQLFYYAEDLCFYQTVPFALVIPENSPHREPIHKYTLQIVESGLYAHWVSRSFYYMVQAGRLHIRDLGEARQSHALMTQDLRDVLFVYALGVLISLLLFAGELIIYWVRVWLFL